MADGYIEKHEQDYERRKAEWQKKLKNTSIRFRRKGEES